MSHIHFWFSKKTSLVLMICFLQLVVLNGCAPGGDQTPATGQNSPQSPQEAPMNQECILKLQDRDEETIFREASKLGHTCTNYEMLEEKIIQEALK